MANAHIRDRVKELRRVRAGDLLANPRNWREHPEAQQNAMRAILKDVGFADALLAYETKDGLMLVDGHLRAGLEPDLEVPVLILDITAKEANKMLVTLDPLAAMAETNRDVLAGLLEEVKFDSADINKMLADLVGVKEPKVGLTDPDDVPLVAKRPYVKRGQVYQLGAHRVMCGDAKDDLPALMKDVAVDVLWTDPPYGVGYVGGTRDALTMENDGPGIRSLLDAVFDAVDDCLAENGRIYLAAPAGLLNMTFRDAFTGAGWRFHEGLIWVKDSMVLGHSDYHLRHEDILYGWKPGPGRAGRGKHAGTKWYGDNAQTSVFEIPRPKRSTEHPTMKPVELIEAHLSNSSAEGDAILDPFLGSGSTLLAAERLGRVCYGMDIEPKYVQVAIERWEAYTGQRAVKVG